MKLGIMADKNRINRFGLILFILGDILAMISTFIPWYSLEVSLNSNNSGFIYDPYLGWIRSILNQSYKPILPNLSSLNIMFFLLNAYAPIMLGIIFGNIKGWMKRNPTKTYVIKLFYIGPLISGLISVLFIIQLVYSGFFIPGMNILGGDQYNTLKYSYKMLLGSIFDMIAFILMVFSGCIIKIRLNPLKKLKIRNYIRNPNKLI